jgi:putative PEP-CTERM system TPR-repeat lipoprotein
MMRLMRILGWPRCFPISCIMGLILAGYLLGIASLHVQAKPASEAAGEHYETAAQYVGQGDLSAAVIELKNALQRDPDYADARLLLGEVYLKLGDARDAEKELLAAARLGHDAARVAVPLGQALLLQHRFDEVLKEFAVEDFEPALAHEILLLRADAHAGLGQFEAARRIYDRVTREAPEEGRAYTGLAQLEIAAGNYAAAEAEAQRALSRQPIDVQALLLQAEARRLGGRAEAALESYQAALDQEPSALVMAVRAQLGLAATLITLGRGDEARKEIAAVRRKAPGLPMAAYLEAVVRLQQQDIAGARRSLTAAGPALEDFPPAQFLFGVVAYAGGEMDTARFWLSRHLNAVPENLQARKLLAAILLRLNAAEDALRLLKEAEAQASDDPQILLLLGSAHLRSGHTVEASSLLQRAAALAPDDPRVLGQLAISYMATGDHDEALAALDASLELDDEASTIGYAMAFTHLRSGAYGKALQVAQDLRRRLPQSAVAANLEGGAYAGLGQPEQARAAFEAALTIDPGYRQARANLAGLKARLGDVDGAEADYQKIVQADESDVTGLMGLAAVADLRGDPAAARQWLERAVTEDAGALLPSLALAEHMAAAGETEAAVVVLEKLARHQPRHPQVLLALGHRQAEAGQHAAAARTYRMLVEISGGDAGARFLLAQTELAANDLDAARRSYEKLLEMAPLSPIVWNNLAWLYHQTGDPRAVDHGERALELAPGAPAVMDTLGWILLADETQIGRALVLLQEAHEAAPDNGDITYHYAAALYRAGNDGAARKLLRTLLQNARPFAARAEAQQLLQSLTQIGAAPPATAGPAPNTSPSTSPSPNTTSPE